MVEARYEPPTAWFSSRSSSVQGADPEEYAYAYLVTSPRVFNYKFSPASFWYLYSVDRKLKAMIAEVNNTFDERRLYFLPFNMNQPGETIREKNDDCSPHSSRANDPGRIFKHCWSKDFHVSPFASRKGGYTLLAQDPLRWSPSDSVRGGGSTVVDIEATLSSSKNRKKLIARLWSTTEPLDPALMSYLDQTRFICSWWWVGLMTFPRILFEALSLSFRRKLHIWYRPEVKPTTIGRTATTEEIILSSIFHKYLEHLIYHVQTPVTIQYTPAGPMSQQWTFHSFPNFKDTVNSKSPAPTSTEAPDPVSPVTAPTYEFHVLTPAFYSRLASFYSLKDALASEMLAPEAEENRTVYAASKKEELYHILLEAEAKAEALAPPHACTPAASKEKVGSLRRYHIWINPASLLDQLGWTLVKRLRRPPERGMYPAPGLPRLRATTQTQAKSPQAEPKASSSPSSPPPETTAFQISSPNAPSHPLDSFVQRTCNPSSQSAYRRAVLRLFLARHLAQGSVRLLRFYLIVVNLCFGVMGVWVAGRMKVESER
ncbi:hypothetical protein MMC30_005339 [Trapelia coarctata]|nr:hypothetical protein [Trapelia coarctata]